MRQINFIVTLGGSLLQRHRNELEPKERTQENSIINLSPTALSSIASCTLVEIHWIDSSCENRFTTLPPFLKIPHSSISSEVTMDVTEDEKKIATPRFDSHDFWVDGNSILIGPAIGHGKFSTVYLGKYFGDLVAVKKQVRRNKALEVYLLRELSVLKMLNHPNLLTYFGAYNEEETEEENLSALYIVTELCQAGDLLNVILNKDIKMDWKIRLNIARQIASALAFLHDRNLIHRDIKSSNCLLTENWVCKISDFGMAREVDVSHELRRMTICGTQEYMAPELFFDEEYSLEIDVFSFGMVLFELLNRKEIGDDKFLERKPLSKFAIDVDAAKAALPTNTPESLISLALQCTEYDPSLRPQANVVVDWLSDLEKTIPSDEEMKHLPSIINTVREASLFNNADIPDSTQNIVQHSPLLAFRQFSFDLADSDNENDGSGAAIHLLDENDRYRSFKLYENDANSMATLSTEIATNDKERVVILKSGYLYKRNETGFRNWKKLWCTLTDTRFTWKSSVETPKKNFFDLKECTLKRTRNNRFLLIEHLHSDEERSELDRRPSVGNTIGISFGSGMSGRSMSPNFPANNSTIPAHSPILRNTSGGVQNISFYQREFAAENALEMEEWVYAIQEAINDLIEERQSEDILFYPTNRQNFSDDTKSLSLADTIKPITEVKSIKEWFSAVGFNEEQASKYNDKFIERGYDNIQMIGEVGLQKEDMSFIGIDNPLHSRIILNSFNASYTDTLKLSVVGWSKFDSMVVYKVVSRWKFNRSSLYMRFPNFRRFDRMLRNEITKDKELCNQVHKIPFLPISQDVGFKSIVAVDDSIYHSRRRDLESYLLSVASVLSDTPKLVLLLKFLELIPTLRIPKSN